MVSEQEKIPTNDEMTGEGISETKMQKFSKFMVKGSKNLGKYMLKTLKEMFQGLRHPEFSFAISGIIISVILLL
ncbi:MAG: hypothetical protein ACTSR4_06715, partial [Candidatus Hodarchaeales archaeon]